MLFLANTPNLICVMTLSLHMGNVPPQVICLGIGCPYMVTLAACVESLIVIKYCFGCSHTRTDFIKIFGTCHILFSSKLFFCIIYTIICLKSVGVRKLQVAIPARSPREMSLTDCILPRYILSRVRVSVRPRTFYTRKKPKPESPASCLFQLIRSAADKLLNWKLQNRPSWVAWC